MEVFGAVALMWNTFRISAVLIVAVSSVHKFELEARMLAGRNAASILLWHAFSKLQNKGGNGPKKQHRASYM